MNPKKLLLLFFFISITPFFSFSQKLNKADLLSDIDSYARQIEKKHPNPFNWVSKEVFYKSIDSLKKNSASLNVDQIIVGFLKINSLLKDEHTTLNFHLKTYYPISFFWFDDGMAALAVLSDYPEIAGAKLIAINDMPIDSATFLCRSLVAVNTTTGYKAKIPFLINNPVVLHGLGITPNADEVFYTFITQKTDTVKIKILPIDQSQGGYESLLPEKQTLRNSNRANYWYKYDEVKKFLYVNYSKCEEITDFPFKDFLESFKKTVETKNPERIIIDLRGNGGGNSWVFRPLISSFATLPQLKNKKVFTLIGRRTFSAAVVNAFLLKTTANSIMVGEETGGKLNHAGSYSSFTLKKTGITVNYSTRDYYLDTTQKGGIIPDVLINNILDDYRKGIDRALEYAIEN